MSASPDPALAGPAPSGPGNLLPSLATAGLIAAVGLIAWGFPGIWLAAALLPGFILGSTGAHVARGVRKVHPVRPGVIALGIFLGGVATAAALGLHAAATDPVEQRIEERVTIEAPIELVWDRVKLADQRVAWSVLMNEVEAIGDARAERVGTRYRVVLNIDGAAMPGEHEIVTYEPARSVGWKVLFPGGGRVEDFTEHISVSEHAGNTRATYVITYRVPSVLGRLFNRLRVRSMFREATKLSLAALLKKATE